MGDEKAVSSVSLKVVPPTDKAKATSASPQKAPQATGATPKKSSNSFAPKVSEPSTTVREVTEEQQKAVTPRVYSLLVQPGQDVIASLVDFAKTHKLVSGVIMSCVGEVENCTVVLGGESKLVANPRLITSASGIVNCVGHPRLNANMVNKNGEGFGGELISCKVCPGCHVDIGILEIPHLGLSRPKISSTVDKNKYRYPLIISHPAIQWVDPKKQQKAQASVNAAGAPPAPGVLKTTNSDSILPDLPKERVGGDYGMVVGNLNITADIGWRANSPPESARPDGREVCVSVSPADPFTRAEFKQDAESLRKPQSTANSIKSLVGALPCVDTSQITLGKPYILPISPRLTDSSSLQPASHSDQASSRGANVPSVTPFGGSRPPGFQSAPTQGVGAGVAGLTPAEMTVLRGGTPARHVRSNSEGSCDYGEILATSTVPLQKAGPKHQSSSALDAMGRGGSGSITPSSGYITPRTGTATPIQPSSKGGAQSPSKQVGTPLGGSPPFPGTPQGGSPGYQAGKFPQGGSPQGGSPSGTIQNSKRNSSEVGIC